MAAPEVTREALWSFDLAEQTVRDLNAYLHAGSMRMPRVPVSSC